ncbi:MAG: hypothetical protein IEMM0008_1731 [bacterium]|nr:MAG: hypothetical protein IEMM0008_1731 [bacterium]
MTKESYVKLTARLMGALNNALLKDPDVNQDLLEKVFYESCRKLQEDGRLKA